MMSASEIPGSRLGVVGTGDFARGLATRCYRNGIDITIGSRKPDQRKQHLPDGDIFTKVKVVSTEECAKMCDIIFIATHPRHHCTLQTFETNFRGKVVIDVSNSMQGGDKSNAEMLARLFPDAHVVKAFNTVSAYALGSEIEDNIPCKICGDEVTSKAVVMQLASRLGFFPVDCGPLEKAADLEKRNRQLFPGWGLPTLVTVIVTVIWTVLAMLRYFDWKNPPYTWERLPTNVVNKIVGCVSISNLCLVYLPGCFAGFTQLCWGTKHRRFPKSLDRFLKMRKQLGLYALLFAVLHMIMSTVLLSPAYYSKWYIQSTDTVPANHTDDVIVKVSSRMNVVGETCVLLGVLAISSMAMLGITSIPSIARGLNWREWRCVQSYLGFACLLLATSHLTVKGATSWIHADSYKDYIATVTFFSLPLPWFTVLLKLILFLPCFHFRLRQIRSGWESGDDPVEEVETYNKRESQRVSSIEMVGADNPVFSA